MKSDFFPGAVVALFCISVIQAATATVTFTGRVTSTGANAVTISEIEVGDQVTGSFVFDTAAMDEVPADSNLGRYAADSLNLSIRGFSYTSADNNIAITNDAALLTEDPFDVFEVVSGLGTVSGPDLSGLPPAQIDIVLVDTDSTVFADDSLPSALDLSEFEIASEAPFGTTGGRLIFRSTMSGEIGEVRFEITSLSLELTPTPSGLDCEILLPQVASGDGFQAEIIVNNTGSEMDTGTIGFFGATGDPLSISVGGQLVAEVPYEITPLGVFHLVTDPVGPIVAGYVCVQSSNQDGQLSGNGIFSFGGSEVSVLPAMPSRAFQLAVEFQTEGPVSTGVAVVNLSEEEVEIKASLLPTAPEFSGQEVQALAETTVTIAPHGHLPRFFDQEEYFADTIADLLSQNGGRFEGSVLLQVLNENPAIRIALTGLRQKLGSGVLAALPATPLM